MNPSLLTVDIVVSGAPGVCSVSPKFAATSPPVFLRKQEGGLTALSDSPFLSGSSQPTQFDKVLAVAKLHISDGAPSGESAPSVSQENQDEPELAAEDRNFLPPNVVVGGQAADLAQSFDKLRMVSNVEPLAAPIASLTAPVSAFAESTGGEDETAEVHQGELQPQNNPAPLISMLPPLISMPPDSELSPVALPTPGLNVTPALASQEAAGGLIPLAVDSGGEPFPTSLNQPVPSDVTANPEQAISGNTEESPVLDKTLTVQSPNGENSTKAGGLDIALVPAPDEIAVSDGQKIPQLDTLMLPALGHAQTISANPEETGFVARKPIDNKTTVSHKTPILFESADSGDRKSINNLSSDSASQKLNVAEIQITTHQTKDSNASVSEVNPNLQQILSDNNAQILSQRSPTSQAGNTANTAYPGDLSLGIRKQILESIHSSLSGGDRQISIRLNPPELGKVFMRFQEHDAQITGLLEVSQTQTKHQIEQVLPQIIRDLQDSGVQIKRLEVVLTEQTDYHASQDQSLLNSWSQQNSSAESGATGSNGSADVRLTNNDGCQDSLLRQAQITDGSINILA